MNCASVITSIPESTYVFSAVWISASCAAHAPARLRASARARLCRSDCGGGAALRRTRGAVRTRERQGRACGGEGRGNATDLAARPEGQLLLDEIDELGAADQSVAVGVGFAEAPSQLRLRRPRIGSRPSAHNGTAATPPRPRPRASWCALLLRNMLRLRTRAHAPVRACVRRVCAARLYECCGGARLDSS
jgi:hypothetical protein